VRASPFRFSVPSTNARAPTGGKSPNIVFDDADLDQAVSWSAHGILCVLFCFSCFTSRLFEGGPDVGES
jgi:hypothetical protein